MPDSYRLGIIEGFFGRPWSWAARRDYADFLAGNGFDTYVYAPKQDPWLRKRWQEPYPGSELAPLIGLAAHYRTKGLRFGIGLSPFELYRDFNARTQRLLVDKLEQLDACAPDLLCILFDDMMGDLRDLASTQLKIVDCILRHSKARSFALCPTYYSDDPLLTKHFGPQPAQYLEDIGNGLDPSIDVLWTGPRVISAHYPREHLESVATRLRRKPLLWDNYPVNDAQRLVDHLHLAPFPGRDCAELRELCTGHLANPMNQPFLSQLPLHALAARYRGAEQAPQEQLTAACSALCPPALAQVLLQDAARFQDQGLQALDTDTRHELLDRYDAFAHPMAEEIRQWLRGDYAFDPACLT